MVALTNTALGMYTGISVPRSGVYSITCIATNKVYVGSSGVYMKKRWSQHKRALGRGKHKNPQLQEDWNKYGESGFVFVAIASCAPEWCRCLELFYFKKLKATDPEFGYNIAKRVIPFKLHGRGMTRKVKLKMGSPELRAEQSRISMQRLDDDPGLKGRLTERLQSREFKRKCRANGDYTKGHGPNAGFGSETIRQKARETMEFRKRIKYREKLIAAIVFGNLHEIA